MVRLRLPYIKNWNSIYKKLLGGSCWGQGFLQNLQKRSFFSFFGNLPTPPFQFSKIPPGFHFWWMNSSYVQEILGISQPLVITPTPLEVKNYEQSCSNRAKWSGHCKVLGNSPYNQSHWAEFNGRNISLREGLEKLNWETGHQWLIFHCPILEFPFSERETA